MKYIQKTINKYNLIFTSPNPVFCSILSKIEPVDFDV